MEPVTCTFCKRPIDTDKAVRYSPWVSKRSGNAYCPDDDIDECLKAFAARVEYIDCTWHKQAA